MTEYHLEMCVDLEIEGFADMDDFDQLSYMASYMQPSVEEILSILSTPLALSDTSYSGVTIKDNKIRIANIYMNIMFNFPIGPGADVYFNSLGYFEMSTGLIVENYGYCTLNNTVKSQINNILLKNGAPEEHLFNGKIQIRDKTDTLWDIAVDIWDIYREENDRYYD